MSLVVGVSREDFDKLEVRLRKDWDAREARKKRLGRSHGIGGLREHLFLLLTTYRCHITQEFLGELLFGVDKATICRSLRWIEGLAVKQLGIKKDVRITKEEAESLIVDCTEQAILRPKKYKTQKKYYSGKKKRHTLKTEAVIDGKGEIKYVSETHAGRVHDLTVRRRSRQFPEAHLYGDSAYQGYQKEHKLLDFPYKRTKNRDLTQGEKEYNQAISRFRVKIEHIFGDIKVFRIMSERYRYPRKRYNLKFCIIAGIVNLKNGF